jgi:hypothetical protein
MDDNIDKKTSLIMFQYMNKEVHRDGLKTNHGIAD